MTDQVRPWLRTSANLCRNYLLPLNHLQRRFRVDLKEQILKARAKSPTVCPPKFVDLEFTGKFLRVGRTAVSGSIGINRLIAARPCKRATAHGLIGKAVVPSTEENAG
jgi:hypothetical protein